ncbi:hypothetical protein BDP27DRAFT_1338193 [Rhodocollybia butyracea]|uniref:GATA-type domain-containing protein n=1 Tax=Rhodocollybia butyracea TaxID=206335 RepID=A0A9P5PEW8_9AGAR|nr:hypothetical protein BDP27DRAFT_1338193 [Rhodocollybia butyracea]
MARKKAVLDKHSILSLLNPTASPPPSDFHNREMRGIAPSQANPMFNHSHRSGREQDNVFPPPPTPRSSRERAYTSPAPGFPHATGYSGGHAHTESHEGGRNYGHESVRNSTYDRNTFTRSVDLPLRHERYPDSSYPTYATSKAQQNLVARSPGGTFINFPLDPNTQYLSISTSPLTTHPKKKTAEPEKMCFVCGITHTVLWRKSKVNPGKYLCNRCGLFERNNRVERAPPAEAHSPTVKRFIVQSPYSSGGDMLG